MPPIRHTLSRDTLPHRDEGCSHAAIVLEGPEPQRFHRADTYTAPSDRRPPPCQEGQTEPQTLLLCQCRHLLGPFLGALCLEMMMMMVVMMIMIMIMIMIMMIMMIMIPLPPLLSPPSSPQLPLSMHSTTLHSGVIQPPTATATYPFPVTNYMLTQTQTPACTCRIH